MFVTFGPIISYVSLSIRYNWFETNYLNTWQTQKKIFYEINVKNDEEDTTTAY